MPAVKTDDPRRPAILSAIKGAVPEVRVTRMRIAFGVVTADVLRRNAYGSYDHVAVATCRCRGEAWLAEVRWLLGFGP